jgi:spermidine synthase
MNASIAVTRLDKVRMFHVSGKVEASSQGHDMRLQRMLGHLPALLHAGPRSVLVVGFGAGVTAGSFIPYPGLEKLVICEIEPLIPRLVGPQFANENAGVLRDPRTQLIIDDGRHYVLTTHERFDIITSDPIHPWVKGNAALYTREYFEQCKRRLRPGGIVTQWVPLYESDEQTVKSEIATFFDVFPNGTIWANDFDGEGYDVVLLGQAEDTRIDAAQMQRRFEYPGVAASLRGAGFSSAADVISTYAGRGPDLSAWLRDAQINRDRNLRLQYLAGLAANSVRASIIFEEILRRRRPIPLGSE